MTWLVLDDNGQDEIDYEREDDRLDHKARNIQGKDRDSLAIRAFVLSECSSADDCMIPDSLAESSHSVEKRKDLSSDEYDL